uniref:Uncharacterized protein n=1 Tax=Avena sativa TaxID=4498 RepID=A0ACD5XBH4_AVESA
MAEMVSSAIVGETVNRIYSAITTGKDKDESDKMTRDGGLERLEMAGIKMEAALETSDKWQITDVSLLHWRKKLKHAAQDCHDAERRCRQMSQEEDEAEQVVRKSSFPRRVAHATKALFVSSLVGSDNQCCSAAVVRRFERLADGASEFMRFVQLGGTPRQNLFFDPLIGHVFAGKSLLYQVSRPGGQQYHYLAIRGMNFEEGGLEAMLYFMYEDCNVWKNSFRLGIMLRLSESTDIVGTTVDCLRLVTPHFKYTADMVIKEITHLPTQDFLKYSESIDRGYWNNVQKTMARWARLDPLCCQGYEKQNGSKIRLSSIFPEPVSHVFLHRHISLCEYNNLLLPGSTTTSGCGDTPSLENFPRLKLVILFMPHDSRGDGLKSPGEATAVEAIDGEIQQHLTHVNVHPEQLDEMLLPKAIHYLYHNTGATTYQTRWSSNHGSAHLCVEKARMLGACSGIKATRPGEGTRSTSTKLLCQMQQDQQVRKVEWKKQVTDFLKLLTVRSSERLRSSFTEWIEQLHLGEHGVA